MLKHFELLIPMVGHFKGGCCGRLLFTYPSYRMTSQRMRNTATILGNTPLECFTKEIVCFTKEIVVVSCFQGIRKGHIYNMVWYDMVYNVLWYDII